MSFWEKVGEAAGHGVATLVFGPSIALERRRMRTVRRAFAAWLGDESYTKQIGTPGHVLRLVERQDAELTFLLECELHVIEDLARITTRFEKLPHVDDDLVHAEKKAPRTREDWNDLANGAVQKAAETVRRGRGEGYR